MEFNKKAFNENKKLIFGLAGIIILVSVMMILFSDTGIFRLEEKELTETGDSTLTKLVINEVMSSNGGAVADPEGNLYDWIEIYNGNNHDVNLKNYGLSDRENEIKWVFPETIIKAKSYLVVYLTGKKQDGLYASFKLSSGGGEVVALKNANGKVIDAVETTPLDKNTVMARDLTGKWFASKKATPGYVNTEEGFQAYQKSLTTTEESPIKINEVLPRNGGNFKDSYGTYPGYVEVINTGDQDVSLKNYGLSNSVLTPFRYQLPDLTLKPNEVAVFYMASDVSNENEHFTGFKLEAKTGVAILTNNKGKVIDQVSYDSLPNGMALLRANKTFYESSQVSPGYPNTKEGIEAFSVHSNKNAETLIINEVMNNNTKYLAQNGGNYYDWIELKNNSKKEILLKDYYLTTNDDLKTMYQLPDVTLKAGETYLVMASGDVLLSNQSYQHAPFKLSEIESLYLTKDKKIVDAMMIADVPLGYSMGRGSQNGFYYFSTPTPGKENGTGVREVSYQAEMSKTPGIYQEKQIELELKANGTIYYTLDGSIPNTSSKIYDGPIFLTKTTVVKAISAENGKIVSPVTVGSYIMNENHTLPVLSVSMKQSEFQSLQSNAWNTEAELVANAELYENGKSFNIPCGFKLFGGSTRGMPKKSFALKFKKQYGVSELHYPVFETRDSSAYNTLVLRSGSQDSEVAMMRDVLMTSLMDGVTNVEVQAYKTVVLYINGNYWGIYNIREKIDDEFISNHYNVDPTKTDVVRIDGDVSTGTSKNYQSLLSYMNSNNLANSKHYDYVKSKLNIESFVDFWAAETWTANNDIINTRLFSNPDIDGGKLHMIFYDLDFGMYNVAHNYFNFTVNPDGMSDFNVSTLMMRSLIKNEDFKKTYLERLSYQLKEVWNKERVLKKIDELYTLLLPEMPRNQARWNQSMSDWNKNVDDLKKFAEKRGSYMVTHAKSFFGLSNSEVEKYFGD